MDEKAEIVNKLNTILAEFKEAVQLLNQAMERRKTLTDSEEHRKETLKWWDYHETIAKHWDRFRSLTNQYIDSYPEGLVAVAFDKSRHVLKEEWRLIYMTLDKIDFIEKA